MHETGEKSEGRRRGQDDRSRADEKQNVPGSEASGEDSRRSHGLRPGMDPNIQAQIDQAFSTGPVR